jgi:type II secretory pathway component GspD/PulD (secretin)
MTFKLTLNLFLFLTFFVVQKSHAQLPDSSVSKTRDTAIAQPTDNFPVPDSVRIPVIDFKNTDIRDALLGLGIQYNINIYCEPDVTGAITIYLTNISVKNAIDFIVKSKNFSYSIDKEIIRIYKYNPPPPLPPPPPQQTFHLVNGKLDVNINSCKVQDLARMFSDSAGVNVLVEGTADKTITARLVKIQAENAVKAIFESNGFQVSLQDGIYYVTNQFAGDKPGSQSTQLKRLAIAVKNSMVNLEVDNASLDQVIRTVAIQSGMNIVIYDKLTGDISAKFANVFIDDVLRFLLQNTKFTFWKEKEIYFVGSREMNQQKTTAIIPLRHIMAEEAEIGKMLPAAITTSATVKYDGEHNAIIVIGSFDVVAEAKEFFEKIDKPIPQVLIEALVVDFNVNKIRDFGMSVFTQAPGDSSGNWLSEQFLPQVNLKPGINKTERILKNVLSTIGLDDYSKILKLPANFKASIRALESADIVKVHSTPQIATINGNPASITIGETRYYKLRKETKAPSDNSNTTVIGTDERFEVIKFNTQLQVTPWVMEDGYVMVKIRPEFNIPRTGGDGTTPPDVDTRVIESMVRLRNGQTIVLGGQRQTENIVSRKGIPFLSAIPVLGWLFSSRTVSKNETQMMIFLTPHVYYGDDNAVSPDDFFGKEVNKIINKYSLDSKDTNEVSKLKSKKPDQLKPDSLSAPADSTHNKRKHSSWLMRKNKKQSSSDSKLEEKRNTSDSTNVVLPVIKKNLEKKPRKVKSKDSKTTPSKLTPEEGTINVH